MTTLNPLPTAFCPMHNTDVLAGDRCSTCGARYQDLICTRCSEPIVTPDGDEDGDYLSTIPCKCPEKKPHPAVEYVTPRSLTDEEWGIIARKRQREIDETGYIAFEDVL